MRIMKTLRLEIVLGLALLACSRVAFSSEIKDAIKTGDVENLKKLIQANPGLVNQKGDKG